jgi:hypothetical protein
VFPKYVTRLHQAGSRLTVLADGCDAMDPVAAAVLLNESDQFFGIKRFPAGYQRTPSSRLMNVALRNNLVLEYTFGDAERDGWGHPFELVLHKIEFTPGELSYWDEINAKFIQRRQRAFENHPELSTCADFWETLNEVLSNAVDMEDVELIKVREEREQLAQLAQNKASCVFDLFAESAAAPAPYRRLVFDCERQWTHLLLKGSDKVGVKAGELEAGEEQSKTWEHFTGSKLNTLILSTVPNQDLPRCIYHQLIILTPLRPLSEIMAMLDWVLSHTFIKESLRIDLLYTRDTPEELAMMETAEAIQGINQNG